MCAWQSQFEAVISGIKSARRLAFECLQAATDMPRHRQFWQDERARHFERARFYLSRARIYRAQMMKEPA